MNSLDGFDPEKFYLGRLCKRSHDWQGTGQSLRYLLANRRNRCFQCRKGHKKTYVEKHPDRVDAREKRRREQNKEAISLTRRNYYERNRDRLRETNREYRDAHKAEISAQRRQYREQNKEAVQVRSAAYREQNRDKINQQWRDRYAANPERRRLTASAYYRQNYEAIRPRNKNYERNWTQTERGKTLKRLAGHRRRSRLRNACTQPPTLEEIIALKDKCNHQCVYCDSDRELALEHFISLHSGGTDCIGNLVIACKSCNSSKHARDPYDWFQTRPTFSQKRWKSILRLLGKTPENYNQIPLF